ncbi:hypothetical protein FRC19_002247 [Serendipita sp. 401]|nr:hypothetical protein FRC15_010099 [Serendipita sp. 397]KAG8804481.1 hypothetical protein FRC16_007890 [Serendipita sp. 398]KAG8827554.1 hypothetical protein FRC19_002247 [Serendipita sp. 401]KAG8878441.1 hypothetical protein FRC20_008364 [Serendipita sp. 405]KAG9057965.1 hypothetical protein FS842_002657 [Serendipita sp. 407]
MEDVGPWPLAGMSLLGFFANVLPTCIATLASIVFSVLTAFNLSRSQQWKLHPLQGSTEQHRRPYRDLGASLVWKYWVISIVGVIETTFGFVWSSHVWLQEPHAHGETRRWYTIFEPKRNTQQLPLVFQTSRSQLWEPGRKSLEAFLIGIQLFLLFGLGSEARQRYLSSLLTVSELSIPYQWLGRQARRVQMIRVWATGPSPENFTPFKPDDIVLEPYVATIPSRNKSRSSSHTLTLPRPMLASVPTSSKRSQLRDYQPLPVVKWRTFQKDRTIPGLVPTGANDDTPSFSLQTGRRPVRNKPLLSSLTPTERRQQTSA